MVWKYHISNAAVVGVNFEMNNTSTYDQFFISHLFLLFMELFD